MREVRSCYVSDAIKIKSKPRIVIFPCNVFANSNIGGTPIPPPIKICCWCSGLMEKPFPKAPKIFRVFPFCKVEKYCVPFPIALCAG